MTNNTIIVIILRNRFIRPSINPQGPDCRSYTSHLEAWVNWNLESRSLIGWSSGSTNQRPSCQLTYVSNCAHDPALNILYFKNTYWKQMLKLSIRLEVKNIGFISCIRPHKDLKMIKRWIKYRTNRRLRTMMKYAPYHPSFNGGVCVCPELNFAKDWE